MATHAQRARPRPHYKPWDKVRGDDLFAMVRLLTLASALFYAAVQFVI